MKISHLTQRKKVDLTLPFGIVKKVGQNIIYGEKIIVSVGDTVIIESNSSKNKKIGLVNEIIKNEFRITPFGFTEGLKVGDRIYLNQKGLNINIGSALLGRVVDSFMNPIDGKGPIDFEQQESVLKDPIKALERGIIDEKFSVGVKSIDALLSCGVGQKIGIFAGSGVGKSMLLGMVVKNSQAKIKVVALIGERGREVPEFIEKNLGGNLKNTVIVVATSDDSPLVRKYGAFSAMSVAEYFRSQGGEVLFVMDSITRFAMAQREIGLSLGEPPTSKGYPPSALTLLAQLMERAGKDKNGAITAFFTILVEGDDLSDPIADQARSILDGHIVLSRELTDHGIYPPINILNSASRVMPDVAHNKQLEWAMRFRRLYSLLKENETLIRIGAYQEGSDAEIDLAIAKKEAMEHFLKQSPKEVFSFDETIEQLAALMQD